MNTLQATGHDMHDGDCIACMEFWPQGYPMPCGCGGYLHATPHADDDGSDEGRVDVECDRCQAKKVLPGP